MFWFKKKPLCVDKILKENSIKFTTTDLPVFKTLDSSSHVIVAYAIVKRFESERAIVNFFSRYPNPTIVKNWNMRTNDGGFNVRFYHEDYS